MKSSTISANRLSLLFFLLASIATASGQTATPKLDPSEPLEKYDMPPAYTPAQQERFRSILARSTGLVVLHHALVFFEARLRNAPVLLD